jgi:hypothetical protein
MDNVIALGGALRLVYAAAAFAAILGIEWFLDHRQTGTTGKAAYQIIDDTALSLAIYRGLRFVGACILAGMVIG